LSSNQISAPELHQLDQRYAAAGGHGRQRNACPIIWASPKERGFLAVQGFPTPRGDEAAIPGEVYNITNTESFGQPNATITKCSSTLPGATPIFGAGGFGQITGSNLALNPRQYQSAVKLIF
jgi:hypothetical protein